MSLNLDSVCVHIGDKLVLDCVSIDVATASTVAVVGPSGAGKSTLLRAIAGIVIPTSGSISVDGVDVTRMPTHRRRIGMVFQDEQLFPHLDVAANIAFGLDVEESLISRAFASPARRRAREARRSERVRDLLGLVGLAGFEDRRIQGLSGGEAKRVALARSLAPEPSVLLLDEPLTGLDRDLHDRLMVDLRDILSSTLTTTVLVTHDIAEAEFLADRIVRLQSR